MRGMRSATRAALSSASRSGSAPGSTGNHGWPMCGVTVASRTPWATSRRAWARESSRILAPSSTPGRRWRCRSTWDICAGPSFPADHRCPPSRRSFLSSSTVAGDPGRTGGRSRRRNRTPMSVQRRRTMIRRVEPGAMWTLRASRSPTERARTRITALQASRRAPAGRGAGRRRGLHAAEAAGGGRLARRRVTRAERQLIRAAGERERRVRDEFDEILHDLRHEAVRAGAELDAALAPLERLRGRWTEIGAVFSELEETIRARELAPFLAHWDGALSVPDFPVTAEEDVPAPFPPTAFVF